MSTMGKWHFAWEQGSVGSRFWTFLVSVVPFVFGTVRVADRSAGTGTGIWSLDILEGVTKWTEILAKYFFEFQYSKAIYNEMVDFLSGIVHGGDGKEDADERELVGKLCLHSKDGITPLGFEGDLHDFSRFLACSLLTEKSGVFRADICRWVAKPVWWQSLLHSRVRRKSVVAAQLERAMMMRLLQTDLGN